MLGLVLLIVLHHYKCRKPSVGKGGGGEGEVYGQGGSHTDSVKNDAK